MERCWSFRSLCLTTCLLAVFIITPSGFARSLVSEPFRANSVSAPMGHHDCQHIVRAAEQHYNIPTSLLRALSLVESGTKKGHHHVAWPWTINVHGKGYTYDTKQQAIQAVRDFMRQGFSSIDVGCMQINLRHHPHAFRTLDDAFDPHQNVAYGAQFLKRLNRHHGSWDAAVSHYHSAHAHHHVPYRQKVYAMWHKLKQNFWPALNDHAAKGVAMRPLWTKGTTKTRHHPTNPYPMRIINGRIVRYFPLQALHQKIAHQKKATHKAGRVTSLHKHDLIKKIKNKNKNS